jgi:hypothetical protein
MAHALPPGGKSRGRRRRKRGAEYSDRPVGGPGLVDHVVKGDDGAGEDTIAQLRRGFLGEVKSNSRACAASSPTC